MMGVSRERSEHDADGRIRHGSENQRRRLHRLSLAANPPLFPCLAEQPLREIQTLLCFREFMLEVLDITFDCLEPRSDVGRW